MKSQNKIIKVKSQEQKNYVFCPFYEPSDDKDTEFISWMDNYLNKKQKEYNISEKSFIYEI